MPPFPKTMNKMAEVFRGHAAARYQLPGVDLDVILARTVHRLFLLKPSCSIFASIVSANNNVDNKKSPHNDAKDVKDWSRRCSDAWRAVVTYKESGVTFGGKLEGSNHGGLLIHFYSLLGLRPYPLLSPHYAKCTKIQDVAKDPSRLCIGVKIIEANEGKRSRSSHRRMPCGQTISAKSSFWRKDGLN